MIGFAGIGNCFPQEANLNIAIPYPSQGVCGIPDFFYPAAIGSVRKTGAKDREGSPETPGRDAQIMDVFRILGEPDSLYLLNELIKERTEDGSSIQTEKALILLIHQSRP
jgi:hypothetical protein